MALQFEKTKIPTISYGTNPYTDAVKSILDGEEAITFTTTVAAVSDTVRKAFDKIKRELQQAGDQLDVTVRSHIFDNVSGRKFILPSEKGATLRLKTNAKDAKAIIQAQVDAENVEEFKVVFWVTDKIIRGSAEEDVEEDTDDTEE